MIRSVLPLTAGAGAAARVESFYRERGVLDRARRFPGCLGTTLWRALPAIPGPAADPGPASPPYTHLVFADWSSPSEYAAWVADPWRSSVTGDLLDLLDRQAGEHIVGTLLEPVPEHRS
jgi:hypothetical protein